MKGKPSTQLSAIFLRYAPIIRSESAVRTVLTLNFFNEILANLPLNATEKVRYLKYGQNLGCLIKRLFFEKKLDFISK